MSSTLARQNNSMSIIANTIDEAANAVGEIRAGGTDTQDRFRHHVSSGPFVDISRLQGLDVLSASPAGAQIGALCTVHQVSTDAAIRKHFPGLAMAAGSLATPQVRHAASMAGALAQRNRCWYYRHEDISCYKKGGNNCPAREGNHQFGVCFDLGPCVSPHPSTLGMVLMAYQAEIEIHGKGKMPIAELFGDGSDPSRDNWLGAAEVIKAIHLPAALPNEQSGYFRSISRARAEWPLVEAFVRWQVLDSEIQSAQVGLGGVANVPILLPKVAAALNGQTPGAETFAKAAALALEGASPLPQTGYKVDLLAPTLEETMLRASKGVWGGEG
jgi:xanthine dehydrogenase YagS FAD-binding subunit